METKSVADVVADIQRYWGSDHTNDELFAIAQHQWEDANGSDNAVKDFVLQVMGCRLEDQLLLWLLQPHAADAAEDLHKLYSACVDFATERLELLESTLDSLLTAALVRAVGCDRNREHRQRQTAEAVEKMEGKVFLKSSARSILRTLEKCEMNTDADGVWTKFLELPNVLESRVFNSRRGRTFVDEAGQIIALQQAELAAVRRCIDSGGSDGEQQTTANMLWDLVTQIIELIKAKTDSSDTTEDGMAADINSELSVETVTDLEDYLRAREPHASTCVSDSSEVELKFDDEEVELSAIEQLSRICSSSEEPLISSDILDKVFNELSMLKDLEVISIHASFLLGMQMRSHCCFVDRCDSAKEEFERRTRRIFNRLTNKVKGLEYAAQLVILSAFCPGLIIQQCIHGAQTDVLHHSLYLNVLRTSPLLMDWNGETGDKTGTLFERELQQTLVDLARDQGRFDRESQNMLSFLLSLVQINSNTSSKHDAPVMTITKLLDGVVNPILCCSSESSELELNLVTLIQQFCQHLVAANADLDIQTTVLKASFEECLAALRSMNDSDPRLGVVVREKLLLLLKNIMELMSDPISTITMEKLDSPLNPSLWTLISLFNSELGNDELCKGLEDVTAVETYLQEKYELNSLAPLSLPNVISAIQVLLWGLLWDSTLLGNESVNTTKTETWRLLNSIAGCEFLGSDATGSVEPIKGSLLIQSAVAETMLECGSVLFQALLSNIIPYLLEYESTELSAEDRLSIPTWAAGMVSEQPEIELQISCQLVSTHAIMRYVAKCWGLSGAVNIQLTTPSNVLVVGSLNHVLVAQDQAITSSQESLSGTLFCIQWLCFLVSAACELQLDALPTWHAIRTQFEITLLRSLHQLDQLRDITVAEARFSQYFVAAWLAYLPAGQFEQVFNFVGTRTNN